MPGDISEPILELQQLYGPGWLQSVMGARELSQVWCGRPSKPPICQERLRDPAAFQLLAPDISASAKYHLLVRQFPFADRAPNPLPNITFLYPEKWKIYQIR